MDLYAFHTSEELKRDLQALQDADSSSVGIITVETLKDEDTFENAAQIRTLYVIMNNLFMHEQIYKENEHVFIIIATDLTHEEFVTKRKQLRRFIMSHQNNFACYGYSWAESSSKIQEHISLSEAYLQTMKSRIVNAAEKRYFSMDRLTGLSSMEFFTDLATQILNNNQIQDDLIFIYFNVDNFKAFNSKYGYEEGDVFLKNLAHIISNAFPNYIVGRPSDDHFVVLTNHVSLLDRIEQVHKGVHNLQKNVVMEIKAGICQCTSGISITQTYDRAKLACDTLKGNYSKNYCYYDEELNKKLLKEKFFVDNLDNAIAQEHLKVFYQPIMRVINNKFCSMESLVRWDDPTLGFLSPGEFIPTLEKHCLINKLDAFVLDRVCRDIAFSMEIGESVVPISVNLSRLDFRLSDVYEVVCSTVEKYHVPHNLLHLEVTESTLNDDEGLAETIVKLQQAGFEIWLDDFGSEYSTLNILQNFHFDVLKIDMKFFSTFTENENSRIIITSIIDMAKRLHMRTVAEGIESQGQYDFLKTIGCDNAQGYLISHPEPLQALYGHESSIEPQNDADYYNKIGRINYTSPNPVEAFKDFSNLYQSVSMAIVEYANDYLTYLFANDAFIDCLISMGVPSLEVSGNVINDDSYKLKTRLTSLAKKTHVSQRMEGIDFIFNGCQINLRALEIAHKGNTMAIFITMVNLSQMENVHKIEQLETALNFLYSIYDRVDLIDVTNNYVENIYLNAQYYQTMFQDKTLDLAIHDFACADIAEADQKKFLEFYDYKTLPERIARSGKDYITQPLRTKHEHNGIGLQLYIIIQVNDGKSVRYLSCVRDIGIEHGLEYDAAITESIKQTTDWYQLIMKETNAAVMEWDLKTGKSYASGSSYKYLLGHENLNDILENKASLDTIYPDDIPAAKEFFEESRSGKDRAEATLRLKLIDGSYCWCRIIGIFMKDSSGNPERTIAIILDIHQEKYERIEQLKFLNRVPTGIGIFEVENGIPRQIFMNDAFYKLIDDDREARLQRQNVSFMNSVYSEDKPKVKALIQKVIDGSDYETLDCRALTGSGSTKWLHLTSSVAIRQGKDLLVYCSYSGIEDRTGSQVS